MIEYSAFLGMCVVAAGVGWLVGQFLTRDIRARTRRIRAYTEALNAERKRVVALGSAATAEDWRNLVRMANEHVD